jgi:predicted DNA-binding transcriptional regulator AlpA
VGKLYDMTELGTAEQVGALIGVSRQRVFQLAVDDPTFPQSVHTFGRLRVWHIPSVVKWSERPEIKERRSTPGRPRSKPKVDDDPATSGQDGGR